MLERGKTIHFIGVGGIGMSALAQVYAEMGYRVSGSDLVDTLIMQRLRQSGVEIFAGHSRKNVQQADVVVCSTAIREDNVERRAAVEAGKEIWKRAQLLADVLATKRSVVVTGCHGKTTTTAMLAWMLVQLEQDPTALIGGEIESLGGNALCGSGEVIVAEGDESDRSILFLEPDIPVLTNVDFDHPDVYEDLMDVQRTFKQFLGRMKPDGIAVICIDDGLTRQLAWETQGRKMTYGFSGDAEIRAADWSETPGSNSAVVWHGEECLGRLQLRVAGRFNMHNALAAVAVSRILGLDFDAVNRALGAFPGTRRRMELKGICRGITVYDDYGHHPTEISAALKALDCKAQGRKIVAFQPHRYSRTQRFAAQFAKALEDAEVLIVTGIYSAGDEPIEGITGRTIFDLIPPADYRFYCESQDECLGRLQEILKPGDTVLTLGAGSIYRVGEKLLDRLR